MGARLKQTNNVMNTARTQTAFVLRQTADGCYWPWVGDSARLIFHNVARHSSPSYSEKFHYIIARAMSHRYVAQPLATLHNTTTHRITLRNVRISYTAWRLYMLHPVAPHRMKMRHVPILNLIYFQFSFSYLKTQKT